jgi:tRNA(fMet)-specific endonuclease VapC
MVDTNLCIYLIQHRPPEVLARFATLSVGEAIMSIVTLAELRHGVERQPELKSRSAQAVTNLLQLIPALPFDEEAAVNYGVLAAAVQARKRDVLDRMIAAHAKSVNCTLITNNEADFADYPGITVENWVSRRIDCV